MNNRFERREKKYILTQAQYEGILSEMPTFMVPDEHSESNIRSVYYDTDSFLLIRRSVEKPYYKEKLRVRSYGIPKSDSEVFVEVKKKLDGVVYKRRSVIPFGAVCENDFSQIADPIIQREIQTFWDYYGQLSPKCLVCCNREYFHDENNSDFRITFDSDINYSVDYPSLDHDGKTDYFFDDNRIIMEIKILGAMPLWCARLLSKHQIYPHSFSKIGYVFTNKILEGIRNDF